jgi:hypothetical protein
MEYSCSFYNLHLQNRSEPKDERCSGYGGTAEPTVGGPQNPATRDRANVRFLLCQSWWLGMTRVGR